jgi:hypothetical protein
MDKTLFTVYGTHHYLRLKRSVNESSSKLLLLFSTQWRVNCWRRMSIAGDQMIVAGVLKESKNPSPLSCSFFFLSLSSFLSRPLLFIGLRKKFQPYLLGMVMMYEDNYYFKFASCLVG